MSHVSSTVHVPYTSNASLEDVAAFLRRASKVVLLTHSKPDGDAVGSTLSLARALTRIGKKATPLYLPPWPDRMNPMLGSTPVLHEKHGTWELPELAEADAVAIVDTGSWNQVADARAWLSTRGNMTVIVDHHAHGDGDVGHLRHIDADSASASELVGELCRLLLGIESYSQFPREIAEPLYLGLATDTGWFRYSNMRPRTLRMAADLIDAGVDANRLYRQIEQNDSPCRLRLVQRALTSLELIDQDRAAIMSVSKADMIECEASQDEVGGLTDLPQTVGTVRVVAMLTELEENLSKVSLRSKSAEDGQVEIDVNKIAQQFGGGGHMHAAGAKIHLPLAAARAKVAKAITGLSG